MQKIMKQEVNLLMGIFTEVFKSIHQRSYHKLNDNKLYPGQPKLLSIIKENEGITQKQLSGKNCVTPATITGMLNKLEAIHYVKRVPDTEDKRIMRVYLTAEGRKASEEAEKLIEEIAHQIFEGFTEEEINALTTMAKKMRNNLKSKSEL